MPGYAVCPFAAKHLTRDAVRSAFKAAWLKSHGREERAFAAQLADLFRQQADAVAAQIRDGSAVGGADDVFRPADWDERLKSILGKCLDQAAMSGAGAEWSMFGPTDDESQPVDGGDKAAHPGSLPIPPTVLDRVRSWLARTLSLSHWSGINQSVRDDVQTVLREGIDAGRSNEAIADRIADKLTGSAESRAMLIARSEVTGALNAGHDATRRELAAKGLVKGKEWLAIVDSATRPEHRAANGQVVGPLASFTVGGESCDHPGDNSLSVGNRARCRCVAVSITSLV